MIAFEPSKAKTLFPYAGALIVFLGVLQQTAYYASFNININEYLDITEFLTAFLGNSLFYVILFLVVIFFDFDSPQETEQKRERNEAMLTEPKLSRRAILFFRGIAGFFLLFNVPMAISIVITYLKHVHISGSIWWFIIWIDGVFPLMFAVTEFKRQYFVAHGKKMEPTYSNLLLIFIYVCFFVFVHGKAEAAGVKDSKTFLYTSFKVGNELVVSDSLHYYIGHTRSFLFYYCQDSSRTLVFPMSQITELSLKPNSQ